MKYVFLQTTTDETLFLFRKKMISYKLIYIVKVGSSD